jgi:CRP/FNR family nitrogen fixation transcriptional regulator
MERLMEHASLKLGSAETAHFAAVHSASEHTLAGIFEMQGVLMKVERNVEIYGEAEPAEYLYQVVKGAVRTYKVLQDGRRQIGAFHLPGDVFGLEADEEYSFSAEAVCDCTLRLARRATIVAMAARDSDLATDLWQRTAEAFRRAQDHMLLLGRKTAEERVATFLLKMAARTASEQLIELPMSRQDIADYLGLTIETVSRTLTLLENRAAIALPSSRRILVRSRTSLQQLNA